jgi:hypothetical protein
MKALTFAILGATTALALTSDPAAAHMAMIYDSTPQQQTYSHIERWSKTTPLNNWVDELGGGTGANSFRSGGIGVEWGFTNTAISSVKFTLYTNFGLSGATVNNTYVGFADLFIDLGNNGTPAAPDFDYAIDFKSEFLNQTPDGSGQAQANVAKLVNLGAPGIGYQTSQQILGTVNGIEYGGLTNICSGSTDAACQAGSRAPETKVTGNSTYDLTVTDAAGSVTLNPPPGSTGSPETYTFAYSVVLSGIDFTGWDTLRLFWGTGWCSNDSVEGTAVVPVPAALPILASALAGFGFVGFRQRKLAA